MNIRLTKKRTEILSLLQSHSGALSAAAIHHHLPHIDLVTIYRTLDLFTKAHLVKQLHLNTKEATYEYQQEPHHHAICVNCERVKHFSAPHEKIAKILGLHDFAIEEIEITVKGHCINPQHSDAYYQSCD